MSARVITWPLPTDPGSRPIHYTRTKAGPLVYMVGDGNGDDPQPDPAPAPQCPYCDSAIPPTPLGHNWWLCEVCSRTFEARD